MLNNKNFWSFLKSTVTLGWILLALIARIAILVLFLVHLSELTVALPIGREKNLSTSRIVIKTLVFGFTWWTPLRKGLING